MKTYYTVSQENTKQALVLLILDYKSFKHNVTYETKWHSIAAQQ